MAGVEGSSMRANFTIYDLHASLSYAHTMQSCQRVRPEYRLQQASRWAVDQWRAAVKVDAGDGYFAIARAAA